MTGCIGLVVAAGKGERFGGEVPKQYRPLGGIAVLRHCLRTFLDHPGVSAVRVVIRPEDRPHYDVAVSGLDLLAPVAGGATRQESGRLGLESLASLGPDRVLVHDAARPFVDAATITRVLAALADHPAAIAALAVTDTLKRGEDGESRGTLDRAGLWRAQTPQAFRYGDILAAHRAAAGTALTDDAAVAEGAGLAVALVPGSEDNIKITTEDDLARAESRLARAAAARGGSETRIGYGLDVHRFGPGDHLWLCGLRLVHDRGLIGHSDADVGLHALTDALLGSIGAGDIGSHFPPDEPRWRGVASDIFLRRAAELVAARGGTVLNVDLTLICERPRIGPHRAAMIARIADILGLARDRVSVKATTTERLGFAGRGEGIVAQAVASVALPGAGAGG